MNPIFEAALEAERVLRAAKFPFCFIGGVAAARVARCHIWIGSSSCSGTTT
jgi:hypothetical protein